MVVDVGVVGDTVAGGEFATGFEGLDEFVRLVLGFRALVDTGGGGLRC